MPSPRGAMVNLRLPSAARRVPAQVRYEDTVRANWEAVIS